MAEIASDIIYDMGDYDLLNSNCQIFCSNFLEKVRGEGYITYSDVINGYKEGDLRILSKPGADQVVMFIRYTGQTVLEKLSKLFD